MKFITLKSEIDKSVNFVGPFNNKEAFESRYVRREKDYFIVYLSSQTGCEKSCRFCHLTATKQTSNYNADFHWFVSQTKPVIEHYKESKEEAKRINFNFMARGEPLENRVILTDWKSLQLELFNTCLELQVNLPMKFNISTIMPSSLLEKSYDSIFDKFTEETYIYYSLYSMNSAFRKKWIPKAMDPNFALDILKRWQDISNKELALHWAFIEGENDDLKTIDDILEGIHSRNIKAKFNLVRYNPYSSKYGKESNEEVLQSNFDYISKNLGSLNSRIVPRVGKDIFASCGQFSEPSLL